MDRNSVLIVEDEVVVARNIEKILSTAGYDLMGSVSTGKEAIEFAREHSPQIILLDIKLEGDLDGVEAGERIFEELFIPVIYITAHADDDTIQRAKLTQPFGYLYKPINRNELVTAIEMALFKHDAEKRVRQSEARFRGLVENSPTGILHVDLEGNIVDVNPKLIEILGSPSEEVTKKINMFTFQPLIDVGAEKTFKDCINSGLPLSIEHPYTSKWGKTSYLRYHLNPVRNTNGSVIGVQANVEDITERVTAETAIRKQEEKFRTIFESAKDMITLVDRKGTILDVNNRIEDLLGYSREEVIGKNFMKIGIIRPSQLPSLGKMFMEAILGGSTDDVMEVDLYHMNGSHVTAEVGTRYIKDNDKVTGVVNVFRDVTRRKREQELQLRSIRERELLSTVSMSLLSIPEDMNLNDHISRTIQSLVGESIVATCIFNKDTEKFRVESVVGIQHFMESIIKLFGRNPIGMEVSVSEKLHSLMTKATLTRARGDLHDQTDGGIGKKTARAIKQLLGLGDTYVMGLVDKGELFGSIGIVLHKGTELHNKEIITTFINQSAIAIKRHEAEFALRKSEENFRTLTSLSPVGIFATDARGNCVYVNQRWSEITGLPIEQALGSGWMSGLHPEDREWVQYEWSEMVRDGGAWGKEYRFVNNKGEVAWVYGLATPLRNDDQQISGYIGINLNITQRKNTEFMLRESEERFRIFFEGAPDAIILAEIDSGRIIDANQAAQRLLGRNHEEIVGIILTDLHPPDMDEFARSAFRDDVQRIQIQDHTDPIETIILRKDGARIPVEVIGKLVHLQGSPIIHGTFRDITKRKKIEEERKHLLTELEEKREELQRVIYGTSHDLRSPLVNVQGFSQEIEDAATRIEHLIQHESISQDIKEQLKAVFDEDIRESLKFISSSITKMDSLISGLLRISRLGTVQIRREPIDMNALLSEIRDTFEFCLKEGTITLEIEDLPSCHGDKDQINQVVSNLIDNAIKYLDPGRKGKIRVSGRTNRGGVVYSVQDNGVGIPEDHRKRIFDIFHRVGAGETSGEGLGLTVVKRILDRHNGRIWVESEVGKGSTFNVFIPIISES